MQPVGMRVFVFVCVAAYILQACAPSKGGW